MDGGKGEFTFGKHRGKTYEWVYEHDRGYFDWARVQSGGRLAAFVAYGKKRELEEVAPMGGEEVDLDSAGKALLRRVDTALRQDKAEKTSKRKAKKHREDLADAQFQVYGKFRSWGYDSPEEMLAEHPIEIKPLKVAKIDLAVPEEDDVDAELLEYAKVLVEVHRSTNPQEQRELHNLDNHTRKQIHTMAETYPDLNVYTKDRRDANDPTKKARKFKESLATMVIAKKQ